MTDMSLRVEIFPFVFRCYFLIELTLSQKMTTFYPWLFVILYLQVHKKQLHRPITIPQVLDSHFKAENIQFTK